MSAAPLMTPGRRVRLKTGLRGVLHSQLHDSLTSRGEEAWYFLPDRPAISGLVVVSQPCTVRPDDIADATDIAPGDWPAQNFRLGWGARQAVYAAAMSGGQLPSLDTINHSTAYWRATR